MTDFPKQNPRPFTRESILDLNPNQIGVYGLFVTNSHWVYVGSGDIRSRLLDHFNGDNYCINANKPTHYVTWVTSDYIEVEKALIVSLKPTCNKRVG